MAAISSGDARTPRSGSWTWLRARGAFARPAGEVLGVGAVAAGLRRAGSEKAAASWGRMDPLE